MLLDTKTEAGRRYWEVEEKTVQSVRYVTCKISFGTDVAVRESEM